MSCSCCRRPRYKSVIMIIILYILLVPLHWNQQVFLTPFTSTSPERTRLMAIMERNYLGFFSLH
ncbi:hypothetical protein WG66_003975 [Moniliophthora roreri]|nr:hypothetical protein WG66_003975 [Moniliophthora roreri]